MAKTGNTNTLESTGIELSELERQRVLDAAAHLAAYKAFWDEYRRRLKIRDDRRAYVWSRLLGTA